MEGNDADLCKKDDAAAEASEMVPSIMLTSSPEDAPSDMAARVSPERLEDVSFTIKVC